MNPFDVTGFLGSAGLIGLVLLIFIETGLLVGFIFPGDSILFTAGIFAAQPTPFAQLWQLLLFLPIAAIIGDQCGYALGRYAGPKVMRGRVMNFIGQGPVDKTYAFFDKYGPFTVLFARFIGIVRTLVPVLAPAQQPAPALQPEPAPAPHHRERLGDPRGRRGPGRAAP